MIRDTKQDLEAHLEEVTVKLQSLTRDSKAPPRPEAADIERFRNEQDTTEQCLGICSQVLSHINGLRLLPVAKGEAASGTTSVGLSTQDLTRAHIMTLSTLKDCCDKLSDTLGRLRDLEEDTKDRLQAVAVSPEQNNKTSPALETRSLAREFDSARQCLSICSDASVWINSGKVHTLEDITIGKDGKQMLIATLGELFDARRVRLGQGAMQVVASSSDASLQELFRAQSSR
ncbi:hypothetical protein CEP52_017283 [Fusarium oligoseptatum]|uniref:Azaphilone pigments biosynthesis cluster protein L N-terminal domain-containing protein n=1 Tax=Fusarium oligoseptatum TaxID=2604345 RepID=A0A428RUL7_9HYPO|nr:hypothetical protein CEP52_017283 [Fusarium oligoseptatum]